MKEFVLNATKHLKFHHCTSRCETRANRYCFNCACQTATSKAIFICESYWANIFPADAQLFERVSLKEYLLKPKEGNSPSFSRTRYLMFKCLHFLGMSPIVLKFYVYQAFVLLSTELFDLTEKIMLNLYPTFLLCLELKFSYYYRHFVKFFTIRLILMKGFCLRAFCFLWPSYITRCY